MAFGSDTFTDTAGTFLESHTPNTGAGWAYISGDAIIMSNANRARGRNANQTARYRFTTAPASADYDVEGAIYRVTNIGSWNGVTGRWKNDATDEGYLARYDSAAGQWQLYKAVAGNYTQLGTYTGDTIASDGTARVVLLSMRGTAIKVYVDGVERISVTDSAIAAANFAGIQLAAASGATPSNTAGYHLDNFAATDAGGVTHTAAAAIAGAGTVAATATRSTFGAATVTGAGSVSASGVRSTFGAASVTGAGSITAAGSRTTFAVAGVAGAGSVSAAGTRSSIATASIAGAGSLTVVATRSTFGAAALLGSGSIAASGERRAVGQAALSGTGSVSAAALRTAVAAASVSGAGTVGVGSYVLRSGVAAVSGQGTLTASGLIVGADDAYPWFEGPIDMEPVGLDSTLNLSR